MVLVGNVLNLVTSVAMRTVSYMALSKESAGTPKGFDVFRAHLLPLSCTGVHVCCLGIVHSS